ncbi:DUF488 family protein [Spirosoma sp. HMF3257]|uniref:DUF488 domain-containing protein n=1 Tax=Spirosoma telluris TaxID=2183553 RepID=A0A327NJ76_9BACT|nr:DUF488 family protein [Spirosoma telluris]RAI74885.1 hypothetical protein HMF3257_12760 [Spirosoma telluris]
MNKKPIYTIGHGTRKFDDFLALLKGSGIEYLIDVRSQPYSKFNPHFNQSILKFSLGQHGITYVFMGDTLGGRPSDPSCYDHEGKVDYELVKTKDFFKSGVDRLRVAYQKDISIAMMCSESKPCECHRSKLIGRALQDEKISLMHIDENGRLKDQTSVINELNKGLSELDLFGRPVNSTSRKSYI